MALRSEWHPSARPAQAELDRSRPSGCIRAREVRASVTHCCSRPSNRRELPATTSFCCGLSKTTTTRKSCTSDMVSSARARPRWSARATIASNTRCRGACRVPPPKFLASSRPRRPGANPPHEIFDFAGTPGGAEAGVEGPGAAHPPALCAGAPEVCAPPGATLSLAPAADAANMRRTFGARTLRRRRSP